MQNDRPNKFVRFWKEKGYYIALSLCIVAVGVSGWYFLSGAVKEDKAVEQTLSIPATVEEPEPQKPARQQVTDRQTAEPVPEQSEPVAAPAEVEAPLTVLPVSGDVLQDHAMDRLVYHATTRDWRVHNGVDLAAEVGTPVRAAKAGTVSAVYEDDYYGTTVVIQHENGYTSHSCNLQQTTHVSVGDTVAAGDLIGSVGDTALLETASEPHLHFEVYCNGEPVDPAGFLY